MTPFQMAVLAALCLPGGLGAFFGYAASENRVRGATSGAFRGLFWSWFSLGLLAGVGIFVTAAQSKGGGIMSPALGGLIMGTIAAVGAAVAGAVGGLLAGAGASLGARSSQMAALLLAWAAPLLVLLGYRLL